VSAALLLMALAANTAMRTNSDGRSVPTFDTASYCRGIAQSSEMSVRTPFIGCKVREDTIKPQIAEFWVALGEPQRRDCNEMANYAGGSYTVLYMCTTKALYGLLPDGRDPVDAFRRERGAK